MKTEFYYKNILKSLLTVLITGLPVCIILIVLNAPNWVIFVSGFGWGYFGMDICSRKWKHFSFKIIE